MASHWALLYFYEQNIERLGPLGPTEPRDGTFFGSSWSLLRWALNHSPCSEEAVLTQLTQETRRRGTENFRAATGIGFEETVRSWTLSLATDDHPERPPERVAALILPSQNSRDVLAGLHNDLPFTFREVPAPGAAA